MKAKARINASRVGDFSDKMFYDLCNNSEIIWFGDSENMKKVEQRAAKLGIELKSFEKSKNKK